MPDSNLSFLYQALKRQSSLGLSFFNSILAHGDLRNNRLNQLSVNLWHLAQRHGCADTRTMVRPGEARGGVEWGEWGPSQRPPSTAVLARHKWPQHNIRAWTSNSPSLPFQKGARPYKVQTALRICKFGILRFNQPQIKNIQGEKKFQKLPRSKT